MPAVDAEVAVDAAARVVDEADLAVVAVEEGLAEVAVARVVTAAVADAAAMVRAAVAAASGIAKAAIWSRM